QQGRANRDGSGLHLPPRGELADFRDPAAATRWLDPEVHNLIALALSSAGRCCPPTAAWPGPERRAGGPSRSTRTTPWTDRPDHRRRLRPGDPRQRGLRRAEHDGRYARPVGYRQRRRESPAREDEPSPRSRLASGAWLTRLRNYSYARSK